MLKEVIAGDFILDEINKKELQNLEFKITQITAIYDINKYHIKSNDCKFIITKIDLNSIRLFVQSDADYKMINRLWNTTAGIIKKYFWDICNVESLKIEYLLNGARIELSFKSKLKLTIDNVYEKCAEPQIVCNNDDESKQICKKLLDKFPQINFIIQSDNDVFYFYWKNAGWFYIDRTSLCNNISAIYYSMLSDMRAEIVEEVINYASILLL